MRILVTELPRMLHDIVRDLLARQDDMEIVAECPALSELGDAIRRCQADAVVLGCGEAELAELGQRLLHARPYLKILAIVGEGRRGVMLVGASRSTLEDISPASLVDALRRSSEAPTSLRPTSRPSTR